MGQLGWKEGTGQRTNNEAVGLVKQETINSRVDGSSVQVFSDK